MIDDESTPVVDESDCDPCGRFFDEELPEPWAKVVSTVISKTGKLELRQTPMGNFSLTRFWADDFRSFDTVTLTREEAEYVAKALMGRSRGNGESTQ